MKEPDTGQYTDYRPAGQEEGELACLDEGMPTQKNQGNSAELSEGEETFPLLTPSGPAPEKGLETSTASNGKGPQEHPQVCESNINDGIAHPSSHTLLLRWLVAVMKRELSLTIKYLKSPAYTSQRLKCAREPRESTQRPKNIEDTRD
ncbi:Hypothetical protein SMAX5B_008637 [Scophthalmus maximus]|uniref:Uncharacterized protein n=1 Tax=Scophthalmus maximus TaxID=52904 RepID=A0A2U9CFX2_SCOMX|nr:Hypothetical protein SMAX5B_008637 [Scophthalmus maximus]